MRMSCNGCRVLRKGCSDACTIRPCLQWIKAPDAQANATVFLAKFYGRAGLLNLLAAAPSDALRPAVFRSLLYEACGRIVNPVYGSVGLLWSGQWQACQAAVEAVLKGHPVVQVDAASSDATPPPPLLDIRHVAKDPETAAAAAGLLRVSRAGRTRFKRSASSSSKPHKQGKKPSKRRAEEEEHEPLLEPMVLLGGSGDEHDDGRAPTPSSHDEESAGSHDHREHEVEAGSEDTDVEAASGSHSHVSQAEPQSHDDDVPAPASSSQVQLLAADDEEEQVGLELTLGLEPLAAVTVRQQQQPRSSSERYCDRTGLSAASSLMGLRLQLPA